MSRTCFRPMPFLPEVKNKPYLHHYITSRACRKYRGNFFGQLLRYSEYNNTKEEPKMMLIVLFVAMLVIMFALEGQSEKRRRHRE